MYMMAIQYYTYVSIYFYMQYSDLTKSQAFDIGQYYSQLQRYQSSLSNKSSLKKQTSNKQLPTFQQNSHIRKTCTHERRSAHPNKARHKYDSDINAGTKNKTGYGKQIGNGKLRLTGEYFNDRNTNNLKYEDEQEANNVIDDAKNYTDNIHSTNFIVQRLLSSLNGIKKNDRFEESMNSQRTQHDNKQHEITLQVHDEWNHKFDETTTVKDYRAHCDPPKKEKVKPLSNQGYKPHKIQIAQKPISFNTQMQSQSYQKNGNTRPVEQNNKKIIEQLQKRDQIYKIVVYNMPKLINIKGKRKKSHIQLTQNLQSIFRRAEMYEKMLKKYQQCLNY